ncbi:MAG: extracellular solute-binding protein [Alphaproteobacteria bacterium]
MKTVFFATALALFPVIAAAQDAPSVRTTHALSLIGPPQYGPDYEHLDYVNPDAPQGGTITLSGIGGFDSLNPYITKGDPAPGVGGVIGSGLVYEALMATPLGEPGAEYGIIAESVTVPEDHSWVEFNLNPKARWHDGKPITVEDVIFSFNTLMEKGQPLHQFYWRNVTDVEKTGERSVKFTFDQPGNRELPQIMGQLPVLPKHYWEGRAFDEPTLDTPLGSGPYKVSEVKPGRSISFERVRDNWAADHPFYAGKYNFDTIAYEFFQDQTVSLEGFKRRTYDFRSENTAKRWATEYEFDAIKEGRVVKAELPSARPTGMQAFVFNTRKPIFQDKMVRKALGYAFDFEWSNKNLFFGQYTRTESYFSNSPMASSGLPSPEELALLEPFRDQLPAAVFEAPFAVPSTDGPGGIRANLRKAAELLREAGWRVDKGVLTHGETGTVLQFEILLVSPDFERIALPFIQNLKRLGVEVTIRVVDPSQYLQRRNEFDFDMIVHTFGQSNSPGNEQRDMWGSDSATRQGSENLIGIEDPVIDALIDKVIFAETREELIVASRALDRVLLHHYFVIPQWHINTFRLAWWDRFGRPDKTPGYSPGVVQTWWVDAEKDQAFKNGRD